MVDVCTKLARENVLATGGEIPEENGETWYSIPSVSPVPSSLVQSWSPGPFDPDNNYTQKEMDLIQVYPVTAFDTVMKKFAPGWTVYFCGKATEPGLSSIEDRENILVTAPMSRDRGVSIHFNPDELGNIKNKDVLVIEAGSRQEEPWKLAVRVDWKIVHEEIIGDVDSFWEKIEIDLSEFDGENPPVPLIVENLNGKMSRNYWANIGISHWQTNPDPE
ncbi:MAG: hypothetical protein KFF73_18680 [Cyclobacteriaceae bacterium]|nr:hypothetical protein [Cyclobacteriaceae bacterium]